MQIEWPRIAVMGAGAVGCYFGGLLARAGAPVTLIGRPQHVEALLQKGLFLESARFQEHIPVSASTEVSAVHDADIVLVCVKTLDTEDAARGIAPHLKNGAIVASLQNGVDNADRIRSAAAIDAIPTAVYVAAQMTGPGAVKHTGRGDLVVGAPSGREGDGELERRIQNLAAVFNRAAIPCVISDNIEGELWMKLIMNCAYNAISALTHKRYARLIEHPGTRGVLLQVVQETIAVAKAAGVRLPSADISAAALKLGDTMATAISSTAQDIGRGKRTEIDSLNGYVVRRGTELGVATPVNNTLHALIKLLEE